MPLFKTLIHSPLGDLRAIADESHLLELCFVETNNNIIKDLTNTPLETENPILDQTKVELSEYFSGKRKKFSLPLSPAGTLFQKGAWKALEKIPYGETRSYKEEAILAGNPKAVRAIGGANNKNPIIIIIPCHRVIGADGSLVGYGAGIERKKWLLDHEKRYKPT